MSQFGQGEGEDTTAEIEGENGTGTGTIQFPRKWENFLIQKIREMSMKKFDDVKLTGSPNVKSQIKREPSFKNNKPEQKVCFFVVF